MQPFTLPPPRSQLVALSHALILSLTGATNSHQVGWGGCALDPTAHPSTAALLIALYYAVQWRIAVSTSDRLPHTARSHT